MTRIRRACSALLLSSAAMASFAACTGAASSSPSSAASIDAPSPATPPASVVGGTPSVEPIPSTDEATAPPPATLAAEGGDPVTGQLGTYVWAGGGSDSPWLPGAPITVGVNEPLTVAFQPAIDVTGWRARFVPSTATDPSGARSLGQGAGTPRFEAPAAGTWTVEVHVDFADGAGNASYFWKVTAR